MERSEKIMQDNKINKRTTNDIEIREIDCLLQKEALSEEDIEQLIKEVESEGLIHAPQYLAEKLFVRVEKEEQIRNSSSQIIQMPRKTSRSNKLQLTLYSMKVALAAAAAIALVVLIPIAGEGMQIDKQSI